MAKSTWKKLDASDKILGRLCSQIAKKVLLGEHIVITNAKNAVISGNRNTTLKKYVDLMNVRTATNPTHGPFHSSRPDTFLRQRIKLMLPNNDRGNKAYRKVHVYINDIPKSKQSKYGKPETIEIEKASASRLSSKFISIGDVCTHIGWSGKSRDLVEFN